MLICMGLYWLAQGHTGLLGAVLVWGGGAVLVCLGLYWCVEAILVVVRTILVCPGRYWFAQDHTGLPGAILV